MPDDLHTPQHGHRPPGVVVLDDDVIVGGAEGRGRWRLLNLRDGLTGTADGDRVDIDATGPPGPWPWDYEVSKNYTGTEGDSRTIDGHTWKVYSTVMAAITDGIATFARAFSVFVVGETAGYVERLDIPTYSHEIHIYGSGPDDTIIGGNVLSHRLGIVDVYFYNLTLDASAGQRIFVANGAVNPKVICTNVIFRKPMGGQQAGSEFYGCEFEQGWLPLATETPQTVTIIGGGASDPWDFQAANVVMEQWNVKGFKLRTSDATWKLYTLTNSKLDFVGTPTSVAEMEAINIENAITNSTISGDFKAPPNGGSVITATLAAGSNHDGVKIIATFQKATTTLAAASRYVNIGGAGTARGWHLDLAETRDGGGNFIEDIGASTHSVEMANAQGCKFTLVPHDKMRVLVSAGSDNIVDSGVIAPGSVGIGLISRWLSEIDLGSSLTGAPLVL